MTMKRVEFTALLDELLKPDQFKSDAGENGLQLEGTDDVGVVVVGVTANLALIDAAVAVGADAIVVHHGIVWGGGIRRLDGWLKKRVATLIRHDVNLYGYHLPLDAQPQFGNNAALCAALGVTSTQPFGRYKGQLIALRGVLDQPLTLDAFAQRAKAAVVDDGDVVHAFGDGQKPIRTVGVCTGGAPDLLHEAIGLGLDCYVTGEVTEYVKAVAEESGTCF
ncbi:MAG TPA: Nif3-like dinuclear metal center hexameric protein, partial [Myxococcota bacterium]